MKKGNKLGNQTYSETKGQGGGITPNTGLEQELPPGRRSAAGAQADEATQREDLNEPATPSIGNTSPQLHSTQPRDSGGAHAMRHGVSSPSHAVTMKTYGQMKAFGNK